MKNNKHILSVLLLAGLGIITFMGTSSFINHRNDTPKTDAQFLVKAAEINLEEIQLGKLAQQKGMMTDVKDFGTMLEKDHTQLLNELTALAGKKGISLPTAVTSEGKEEYKELYNKSVKRFDEEYCEVMIKGHKKAIELFEEASEDSKDSDIKAWAMATLPALKMHLEHAKICKAKCEKM